MRVVIEVETDDEYADPSHPTGITNEAFERIVSDTPEHGPGALSWLGEVQEVRKA